MFQQARNFTITGGQFTVGQDAGTNTVLIITVGRSDAGLVSTILWQHVAAGAIFDSAERYPPGKCHPQTRRKVIDQMTTWIKDANPLQRILWMYGPAGSGKSALMQSLCELLRDSYPELKGGSFFFAKGHLVRGNANRLFVTLAYQLAIHFPAVRAAINDALAQDPSLPTKSMDIQLRSLIINPVLRCEEFLTTIPTLFIDGLDECESDRTQHQIITLISKSIIEHDLPIRFIIASRPEYWIRDIFETSPLPDITYPLSLRDDTDADKDIKAYLTDRFEKIRQDNMRIMQSVKLPWPPEYIVDRFVYEASGQYIYALTILKFVGNDSLYNDPQEQLKILLNSGPDRAPAFTELDRLYQTVLSVHRRWEVMKRVLAGLLMGVNQTFIRVLLGVPQTEITLALDALNSLIDISPPEPLSEDGQILTPIFGSLLEDEVISFFHLSCREFLQDQARSGSYYVNVTTIIGEAISAFLAVIQRNLDNNYETEPHISFNTTISEYRRMMKALVEIGKSWDYEIQGLLPALNCMMERGRHFDPGRRMNYPACFMQDMQWLSSLLRQVQGVAQYTDDHSCYVISKQLRHFASVARKSGIHLLSLSEGFSVTPTLFFIGHMSWHGSFGITIQDLLKIPGSTVVNVLSTIRQHRHLIELWYNKPKNMQDMSDVVSNYRDDPALMFLHDFRGDLEGSDPLLLRHDNALIHDIDPMARWTMDNEGWLSHREWTNQHVSLVSEFVKSVMIHLDNDWEHLVCRGFYELSVKHAILVDFFDNGDLSDIRGKGYFKNEYHVSLVEVMTDSEAWMALFPFRPKLWTEVDSLINPVLGWFDRQLTDPEAIRLMEQHDVLLPQKLTTAMNCILQHCFIPIFKTRYFSDLLISTLPEENVEKTIRLKVIQSNLLEEEADFIPSEDHLFSVPDFLKRQDPPSPIPTSEWYTCYSAYILNTRAKELYRKARPEFGQQEIRRSSSSSYSRSSKSRATITSFDDIGFECFQYAQRTPQNLDALRAIKHLSWQMHHRGSGFCVEWPFFSSARDFLKGYEPSVLRPEELSDFESWLQDIEESYEQKIRIERKRLSMTSEEQQDLGTDLAEYDPHRTSVNADASRKRPTFLQRLRRLWKSPKTSKDIKT